MSAKFNSIIKSKRPVLVEFYADWCVPCKQIAPVLKKVKESCKEGVRIVKVNVDNNPEIATKYQIRSLPTVMIFKAGESKWTGLGVHTVNEIQTVLKQLHTQQVS